MDDRFSALDGDLMTEALMMEEFNRLVQETPELENMDIPAPSPVAVAPAPVAPAPVPVAPPIMKRAPAPAAKDGTLEEMIQLAQQQNREKLQQYQSYGKTLQPKNALVFFDAFDEEEGIIPTKTTGGFFFSYDGFGVAVNPGKQFLQRFHDTGHHISEIDAVVVTRDEQEDVQDLFAIYQLNLQCNLHTSEFHLIRYFLHPSVYRRASTQLKPHFKQERNFLSSLDLFEDRETLDLSNRIKMTYMNADAAKEGGLALVFDLQTKRIGYFARAPYSVDCLHKLNQCDVLILGFDETNSQDLMMHAQMEQSLGFTGTFNLCSELAPKVAFVVEHSGNSGDIRMELLKRLKMSLQKVGNGTLLFPVECGLQLDMASMKLEGTTEEWIDLKDVRVIQPDGAYSPLHFISNESIL